MYLMEDLIRLDKWFDPPSQDSETPFGDSVLAAVVPQDGRFGGPVTSNA